MTQGPWDGVMPGGRIHRPRGRQEGEAIAASPTSARRPSPATARARRVKPGRHHGLRLATLTLALVVLAPPPASAGTAEAGTVSSAQGRAATATSLDRRVELLSAELQLTPEQQVKVRALLEQQREQVRRLWSDTTLAPALRVGRTQGISDRTVEEIHGLLYESQRRRYIQPRQREAAVGTAGADVQAWTQAEARP
jgi:hypothetical protein